MINPWARTARAGSTSGSGLGGMTGMPDSVNGPAKLPLFEPDCPAIRARQARSQPHGKNGRSCSPS